MKKNLFRRALCLILSLTILLGTLGIATSAASLKGEENTSASLEEMQSLVGTLSYREYMNTYSDVVNREGLGSVSIDVTNTGSREGKEIVQLYIGDEESSLERPVKELKGFKKVALAPGETKRVTFEINPDMLKFYDPERGWVLEEGGFTAYVGAASDDIRSIVKFNI